MTLYEIGNALLEILDSMDDVQAGEEGEIGEDPLAALDALAMERLTKVDAICRYMRTRASRAAGIQAEIDRLQCAKRVEDNACDRLKKYLYASMIQLGEQKLVTDLFKLRIQRNSQPSLTIGDEKALPEWAKRVTVSADRSAILARWRKEGTLPEGVGIEEGSHLRIA